MVVVHINVDGSYKDGLLIWVVSGDRVTKNYWTESNACTIDVQLGNVSITVYERTKFVNIGTMVCTVLAGGSETTEITRRLQRQPNLTGRALKKITCTVAAPYSIQKLEITEPNPRCTKVQKSATWPVDVCVGHGCPALRAIDVSDSNCATLATRWASYVRFAYLLGSTAPTPPNFYTAFSVALGVVGGCYHFEDEDDRGVAGLTLCRADDCDGMAYSAVFFWNLLLKNYARVRPHLKGKQELNLLDWGVRRYPTAFVVFGLSANPKPPHKQFYHAWAACEARPPSMYKAFECLNATEQSAVIALQLTAAQWADGAHFPCRRLKWDALTPQQCSALTALGWNKDMWHAQPKIHVECTSAFSFESEGTFPTEEITEMQARYRKDPNFTKKKRKLLFSGIRRAPTTMEFYINYDQIIGAHFTFAYSRARSYSDWLKSDAMYSRAMPECCDASCSEEREKLAPVILRSEKEAKMLQRPSVGIGVMPANLSPGDEYVITNWNPAKPPKSTKTWFPRCVVLDWCNSWVMWTLTKSHFEDQSMASGAMCSKR